MEAEALVGTEILTWKEGDDDRFWIAAWVRRDVVVQGSTEREAVDALLMHIGYLWVINEASKSTARPLEEKVAEWKKLHLKAHADSDLERRTNK